MQYRFTADYRSNFGTFHEGQEVTFDDRDAAWLLRDAPGIIEPVTPEQSSEQPANDRQVKRAPKKRGR